MKGLEYWEVNAKVFEELKGKSGPLGNAWISWR